jgi:hypothetical protein
MTREDFITWINNDEPIIWFLWWIKTDIELDSKVPEDFINSSKIKTETYYEDIIVYDDNEEEMFQKIEKTRPVLDDNLEPIMEQKTWKEYVWWNYIEDEFNYIPLGYRDEHWNLCHIVSYEELKQWVNFFGINNILTKSEYYLTIKWIRNLWLDLEE